MIEDEEPIVKNVYLYAFNENDELLCFKGNLYSTFHIHKLFFISYDGKARYKCSAFPATSFHLAMWLYGEDKEKAIENFIQQYEKRNIKLQKDIDKNNKFIQNLKLLKGEN